MDFFNDLVSALESGTSAEELAKSFTNALNRANKEHMENQKKEEARKKKIASATAFYTSAKAYFVEYFPELANLMAGLTIDEFIDSIDTVSKTCTPALKATTKIITDIKNEDDPIMRFLKDSGLM